jgi:LTXXQ motif family protein
MTAWLLARTASDTSEWLVYARHAYGRGFAHNGFWNHRFADGRFGHGWRGWRGYGWWGPVFWPYAFGDIFAFALWPYDYYDPFWNYGANWIVSSLFWPGGAPGYYNYGDGGYYGDIYRTARRTTGTSTASVSPELQQDACGNLGPGLTQLPEAKIEKAIAPITDEQRAALNAFTAATAKGADLMKQACPADAPLTPPAKLDAVKQRLDAMKSAIGIVRDPLDKFYGLLGDTQRQRLNQALLMSPRGNKASSQQASNFNAAKLCSKNGPAFGDLPAAEIEKAVNLDEGQRGKLDQLKTVSQKADDIANGGCVSTMPSAVGARLDATEKRVDALIEAANTLKPAVDDFYASLSDEQKARFNSMNPTAQASAGSGPATSNGASSGESGIGGDKKAAH